MLQFLYKYHRECGSYRKSPHGYFNLKFCKNQISFAFRALCVLSPMRILFWRSEQEVPFLYSLYSFSACVPYPAATVTGSQLPAEPSRSASLRGEDGLCLLQAAELGVSVNPGGCWVSSQGFPPLTMRRIPAAALSLTLLQDSPHCLRDAARSPRVNVLLPGGDGLPLSTVHLLLYRFSRRYHLSILFTHLPHIRLHLYTDYFFKLIIIFTGLPTLDSLHLSTGAAMIRGL